jgi:deoxycytidylate deaminase
MDYTNFVSQNIQSCIQMSDIHVNYTTKDTLKKLLARYICLIFHPGIVTPTKIERCMQVAYTAKYNSGCISRQVGAVVTDQDYSIKAVGWNDIPEGQVPCLLRSCQGLLDKKDIEAFSEYEKKSTDFQQKLGMLYNLKGKDLKGRNVSFCFKNVYNTLEEGNNDVYVRALHAEENAFLQITKYGGGGIKGGMLFTTSSPCELCSKKAFQLGIKNIYYIDNYKGLSKEQILGSGTKHNRPALELFTGAIGKAYNQLYHPLISVKDEVAALLELDTLKKSLSQKEKGRIKTRSSK